MDMDRLGPEILKESEIIKAIHHLTDGKSEGADGIPAEMWETIGTVGVDTFVELCSNIYRTGVWPEDWVESVLIPIEKKSQTTRCEEHRTISLIVHGSKVILRVLTSRIETKDNAHPSRDKFGFRKGFGTREAIAAIRLLGERCIDHEQDVYVCFVDYEKAYDRVNWVKLLEVLKSIGVDWHDRRLIERLYMGQRAR